MKTRRPFLLYAGILALLLGAGGVAAYFAWDLGDYARALAMQRVRKGKANNYARKGFLRTFDNAVIVDLRAHHAASAASAASWCRRLIHAHADKEFVEAYKEDIPAMYGLLEKGLAEGAVRLSLKCDGRVLLMRNMLHNVGVASRIVHGLYVPADSGVASHTFLEVRQDGAWVVQDPYFDVSFVDLRTQAPAGLLDLCRGAPADFAPSADSAADVLRDNREFFARIYSIVVYDHREDGERSVVVFNCAKLGIGALEEFYRDGRFLPMRNYLAKKWYDYVPVDL